MREKLIEELKKDKTEFEQFILITDKYVQANVEGRQWILTLLATAIDNFIEHEKLDIEDVDKLAKAVKASQSEDGMLKLLKEMLNELKERMEEK